MPSLQFLKCKFGSHQWDEWKCLQPSTQNGGPKGSSGKYCELERVCKYCQMKEQKRGDLHSWSGWEHIENTCTKERVCEHCKARETRTRHRFWGDWAHLSPRSCEVVRHCACGAEAKKTEHEWEYIDTDYFWGNRCKFCGLERGVRN